VNQQTRNRWSDRAIIAKKRINLRKIAANLLLFSSNKIACTSLNEGFLAQKPQQIGELLSNSRLKDLCLRL
jgi:hypothetical protein